MTLPTPALGLALVLVSIGMGVVSPATATRSLPVCPWSPWGPNPIPSGWSGFWTSTTAGRSEFEDGSSVLRQQYREDATTALALLDGEHVLADSIRTLRQAF